MERFAGSALPSYHDRTTLSMHFVPRTAIEYTIGGMSMRKMDLILIAAALAAAILIILTVFCHPAVETGSWGLSFRQEGMPPVGTAGIAQLQALNAA